MQIYNAELDIDLLEFSDRFGNIRSTAGCSLKGKVEFDARIKLLGELLKKFGDETIGEVYLKESEFAHHCDRALQLNGIDPDWVNEAILINLLFLYKHSPGLLVQLNRSQKSEVRSQKSGEKEATYYDLLAGLYANTQDLEQAMRLAEDKPWKEVVGAITKVASNKKQVASKSAPAQGDRTLDSAVLLETNATCSSTETAKTAVAYKTALSRNMLALMNARAKTKIR